MITFYIKNFKICFNFKVTTVCPPVLSGCFFENRNYFIPNFHKLFDYRLRFPIRRLHNGFSTFHLSGKKTQREEEPTSRRF